MIIKRRFLNKFRAIQTIVLSLPKTIVVFDFTHLVYMALRILIAN